jgi:hypothetical protein
MQRIVFLLRIAPFLYSFISLAESTHSLPIKHSTTKEVIYTHPGETPSIKTLAELELYFRVGVAECEIENCKKEIVCLDELKTTIRKTLKNLNRTNTSKLVLILMEIDDSRDTCEKEIAKREDQTNFLIGKLQRKAPSDFSTTINTEESAPSPTLPQKIVEKHQPPTLPQSTHIKSFY